MAEAKSEASSSRRPATPLVYLHGADNEAEKWYCIDVDKLVMMNSSSSTTNICPAVRIDDEYFGGFACIDGYIYWAGGGFRVSRVESVHLLRHKTGTGDGNAKWEIVSSNERLRKRCPRPFIAAVVNNIYVLRGFNLTFEESSSGLRRRTYGEIYNLNTKTWTSLVCDINVDEPSFFEHNFLLGEPTRIGFISLKKGTIRFYNVTTGEWVIQYHTSLALRSLKSPLEYGLGACKDLSMLTHAVITQPPVVNNSTLYWFSFDLYLFGYDLVQKRWFLSKCLDTELSRVSHTFMSLGHRPPIPILVDLCNGLFLLIIIEHGKLDLATLRVSKDDKADIYSLSVIVEPLPSLFTNRQFNPTWAKAMPVLCAKAM